MKNKNSILIIFFILLIISIDSINSFPRPKRNKEVGAIVGKFKKNFDILDWKIRFFLKNNETDKIYSFISDDDYFYKLNLPPGNYRLFKISLYREDYEYSYHASGLLLKEQSIDIEIEANKITPIQYFEVHIMQIGKNQIRYGINKNFNITNEYINELIDYFNSKDQVRSWKNFEWKNNLVEE